MTARKWKEMSTIRVISALVVILAVVSSQFDTEGSYNMRHSFKPPYYGGMVPFWEIRGTTRIEDNFIRLTGLVESQEGLLWNTEKVHMKMWQVETELQIHGGGYRAADGMALWFVDRMGESGHVFGSKDMFKGFAVFLDSFDNVLQTPSPRINLAVNDGSISFKAADNGKNMVVDSCNVDFRGSAFKIKVSFDGSRAVVSYDFGNGRYSECASADVPFIGDGVYFGVSAATGGLFDNHDVLSYKAYDLGAANAHYDHNQNNQPPIEQAAPSEPIRREPPAYQPPVTPPPQHTPPAYEPPQYNPSPRIRIPGNYGGSIPSEMPNTGGLEQRLASLEGVISNLEVKVHSISTDTHRQLEVHQNQLRENIDVLKTELGAVRREVGSVSGLLREIQQLHQKIQTAVTTSQNSLNSANDVKKMITRMETEGSGSSSVWVIIVAFQAVFLFALFPCKALLSKVGGSKGMGSRRAGSGFLP